MDLNKSTANPECSGNCSSCGVSHECSSCDKQKAIKNNIKHVIGVVSGKGGVGKSMVTSMLAVLFNRKGYNVGILDADITGPSIPKMFGININAKANEEGIIPEKTANGIKIMSVNLLLKDPEAPVVWRGPVIANAVKQFWEDVVWGDLDYMFIDMPPGTGDVPLTVYQNIKLDGVIIVTSPQDLVSLIVKKAYNMASMMNVPILGLVENMSYVLCPDCNKHIHVFGKSNSENICNELGTLLLGKIPIDPILSSLSDEGEFEKNNADYLSSSADSIEKVLS